MILGVDPGRRRVGLAIADEETRWARELETIDGSGVDPIERIAEIVRNEGVRLVVVGRPTDLSGAAGPAVAEQSAFVAALRDALDVDVVEYDERLTTVIAERSLREAGLRGERLKRRLDAGAARVMLQDFLDSTR